MVDWLTAMIIAGALALAAFGLGTAALGRPPGRWHAVALAVATVPLLGQAVVAAVRVLDGAHPGAIFASYLVTALLVPPAAWVLARMEPTRWGSAIVGAAGLVVAPLVLRLSQLWQAAGG